VVIKTLKPNETHQLPQKVMEMDGLIGCHHFGHRSHHLLQLRRRSRSYHTSTAQMFRCRQQQPLPKVKIIKSLNVVEKGQPVGSKSIVIEIKETVIKSVLLANQNGHIPIRRRHPVMVVMIIKVGGDRMIRNLSLTSHDQGHDLDHVHTKAAAAAAARVHSKPNGMNSSESKN
jgi:hypothetical protein